jgi:hypothetical protein
MYRSVLLYQSKTEARYEAGQKKLQDDLKSAARKGGFELRTIHL